MTHHWHTRLEQARKLLAQGYPDQAVLIGGQVLESLFRWLYRETIPRLSPQEHESLTKALAEFRKPADELTLGQLLGLFRKTGLLEIAARELRRDLSPLRRADDWTDLRNRAAHPGERPVSRTEAEAFLGAVALYLQHAGLAEPPSAAGPLRPWHQVVLPHRDIREGRLDESIFAADLSDVVAGRGPLEYLDPATFFRRTYPTQGLIHLMGAVLSRLSGLGRGEAVIQIQTPFGGGKTHALIALYHLFATYGAQWERVPTAELPDTVLRTLEEAGAARVPSARVVAFVGTAPDPLAGKTPWGVLAEEVGNYDLLAPHDRARRAPGKDLLHRLLGDEPTLILMDELAEYVVKAKDFRDQILAFLQELTEVVRVAPRCALIVTLPSSAPYGEEGERALSQLQRIFGRVEAIYTPVEGEEVYEVIRRRLFEAPPDPTEARRVAEAYWQLYHRLGDDVPREAREPAYREKLQWAYPFHPELIDVLFERWSTFANFQRTRGVLRFLAEVVADLYRKEHPAPLIQPAHLELTNPALRQELIKHIGNQYEGVIAADIADTNARAQKIDRELGGEYGRYRIASSLATAVFFYSFSGGERQGVTAGRLRLAVMREGIPPAVFGDALKRLEDELWYLHVEGGLYAFRSQPNLNRILLEKEEAVREEDIHAEIHRQVEAIAGRDLRVVLWPRASQDDPDTREVKLAVLSGEYVRSGSALIPFAEELLTRCGTPFRTYRNTLLVLAPDIGEWATLSARVRRLLALRAIEGDRALRQGLAEENRRALQSKREDLEKGIPFQLLMTYRHLAKLGPEGVEWLDLGIPTTGARESLSGRVKEMLRSRDLLVGRIAPSRLLQKALREDEAHKPLRDVVEAFLRYPQLPMLEGESVAWTAVRQGVLEGAFGVQVGERVYFREPLPDLAALEDGVLVREIAPAAEEAVPEPAPASVAAEGAAGTPGVMAAEPVGAPPTAMASVGCYALRARVAWEKLADFVRGVVMPLQQEADLEIEVVLRARGRGGGIRRGVLERAVRETLQQIRAEIVEEREE
ncbi:MAG: DUF499 domain-containing protein [Anaerolineae bacterium]|nr:DUF499 domain-containing protein [Anaerolineae bacterium]